MGWMKGETLKVDARAVLEANGPEGVRTVAVVEDDDVGELDGTVDEPGRVWLVGPVADAEVGDPPPVRVKAAFFFLCIVAEA